MADLYMVVICLCYFPTLYHNDIFPPGGNMTGRNMLEYHHHHHHHGSLGRWKIPAPGSILWFSASKTTFALEENTDGEVW